MNILDSIVKGKQTFYKQYGYPANAIKMNSATIDVIREQAPEQAPPFCAVLGLLVVIDETATAVSIYNTNRFATNRLYL